MKIVVVGYGTRGDVEPVAAVARELLGRGHDVRVAVPPNLLGFVESAGLAAVAYGPDSRKELATAGDLVGDPSTALRNPIGMFSTVMEHVGQVKAEKTATLKSLTEGADLLVAGFNEQGVAANVAEYYGIALAALHVFPARLWISEGPAAVIAKQTDDAQRHALGLPAATGPSASLEIQAYDELCLPGPVAQWVQSDQHGPARPLVGALTLGLPAEADDEVLSWIADGTPPIYFGFGSTPIPSPDETVAVLSGACLELGERALICSGPNDLTDTPDSHDVKVVGAVNHAAIFPACRAVVHHGGAGTTAAGLRAGMPTLIMSFWLDQPVWAAGVTRLQVGLGRAFYDSTFDSLVDDLQTVLAPHCATRAREVASQMTTAAQSLARAGDLLEDAVRRGRTG
ncbi:MAG: glycosyltransferase [Mycobacterium sp.]|uniref:glycosyltransferase n=1 Tax=Mycobacterium sp. TaxID=1785 RepID=UPI001EC28CE4|nr:glycosyltransferase [Mycobacterium sp.]MBW0017412.1 glycosyltransferase [Mycobacterium sp.]